MSRNPGAFVTVLGVHIHTVTMKGLIRRAVDWAKAGEHRTIMYANIHVLNTAYRDAGLRDLLNGADLVYCDGEGVRLSAQLLDQMFPERMTGADWLLPLCSLCEREGIGIFFLGSEPGVSAQAVAAIRESCPTLIMGAHHGYLSDSEISDRAVQAVNDSEAGIVLIGMGTPIQERWIAANRDRLRVPVVWAVGALFDFVAGVQQRGPRWMLDHGLEWMFRLWSDPKRLWRRYIVGNPLFLWRVLKQRWNLGSLSEQ